MDYFKKYTQKQKLKKIQSRSNSFISFAIIFSSIFVIFLMIRNLEKKEVKEEVKLEYSDELVTTPEVESIDGAMFDDQSEVVAEAIVENKKEAEVVVEEVAVKVEIPDAKKIEKINNYINKYSSNSPMSSQDILDLSKKYNIEVRVFLAFAHNESHFGTKGRAVGTNNPYNVGNTDFGDYKPVRCGVANICLQNVKTGTELFAKLIRNKYLHQDEKGTLEVLVYRNFIAVRGNVAGKRYMTDGQAVLKYRTRINDMNYLGINF